MPILVASDSEVVVIHDERGTSGLEGRLIMAVAASPADPDLVWAGTEPIEVWRSRDA